MAKDKKDKKAGVKVPKKLRKVGRKAMKLAGEPVVSEVVAAALLSAAEALREKPGVRRAVVKAGSGALDAAEKAGKKSGKIGESLRKLAIDLARQTLDNWDRGDGGGKPQASSRKKAAKGPGKKAKPSS